jgi:hypothetical protein
MSALCQEQTSLLKLERPPIEAASSREMMN